MQNGIYSIFCHPYRDLTLTSSVLNDVASIEQAVRESWPRPRAVAVATKPSEAGPACGACKSLLGRVWDPVSLAFLTVL